MSSSPWRSQYGQASTKTARIAVAVRGNLRHASLEIASSGSTLITSNDEFLYSRSYMSARHSLIMPYTFEFFCFSNTSRAVRRALDFSPGRT
jgi:hypothetical protein